ncbi:RNA polymerase sigma factor Sig [Acidimicrobiaceae bacterium]|nr:RNA polymerase sigma factor Sig [Acidimicrobiaceae bacterium]
MTRALADQGRNIRIPGHMMEIVNRVQRSERDLTSELRRNPTPEEVAARCSLSVEKLLEIMHSRYLRQAWTPQLDTIPTT